MREMVQTKREPAKGEPAVEVERSTPPRSGPALDERTPEQAANAIQRAIASAKAAPPPLVQTKLAVGPAGDQYEQEADRVARDVVQMLRSQPSESDGPGLVAPDGGVRRSTVTGVGPVVSQRIQAKSSAPVVGAQGGELDAETDEAINRAKGGGEPLEQGVRSSMEDAFGADFSAVRVHADGGANDLNERIQAKAFTTGSDIFFRGGEYNPSESSGQELLAHELTHVVQQGGSAVQRSTIHRDFWEDRLTEEYGEEGAQPFMNGSDGARDEASAAVSGGAAAASPEQSVKPAEKASKDKTYGKKAKTSESDTFDGTTQNTASTSVLVGAGAALTFVESASDTEIKSTVEFMARAGAFGEAERKKAYERGNLSLEAGGKATASAGASVDMKSGLTIKPGLMEALEATFEAAAKVGADATLEGFIKGSYGPISAELAGKLSVFAGAAASVSGTLSVGLLKTGVAGSASAFAGVKAEAEASLKIGLGDAEVAATIEGSLMAGAEAAAKGEFTIGLSGVTIEGEAEAFAGLKASAKASGSVAYKGRTIFSASGEVSVSAGIGGKVKGGFSASGGKVTLSGGLAASLGLGAGVEFDIELDLYALVAAIEEMIVNAFLAQKDEINRGSPDSERVPLLDQTQAVKMHKLGYETMLNDFRAYSKKKAKQGKHGVKMLRVQEILDKRYPKLKDSYCFLETDDGIEMAIKDVFRVDAMVQAGQLRYWVPLK